MSVAHPGMLHDYGGFPPETCKITYPASGAPDLAQRTADLIKSAGLPTHLDPKRGFDHGTFAPAYVMYPNAELPIFQISLQHSYDPAAHFALGRAIAPLRYEGVLIVGLRLSYHNLRLFGPGAKAPSAAFDAGLSDTMALHGDQRTNALLDWDKAPSARICHPKEDHLVPLFAALGAAEFEPATLTYHDKNIFGGVNASSDRIG